MNLFQEGSCRWSYSVRGLTWATAKFGDAVLVSDAAETAADDRNLVVLNDPDELPPILAGHLTPQRRARAQSFYAGVAELFERWAARRPGRHTQRAYRRDVLSFIDFLGLLWPQDAFRLLLASVADVQRWRDAMMAATKAPQDPQPPHLLALQLLQMSRRRCRRTQAARRRP